MLRSFIPFVLASLGFTMILWADRSPLFNWQTSEIVADVSSVCDFDLPTDLTTRLGESFEARKTDGLKIVVIRSRTDDLLNRVSLVVDKFVPWLSAGVLLSISYLWQSPLQNRQNRASQIIMAFVLTAAAVFICFFLSQLVRSAGPAVGWQLYHFGDSCQGTITFNAKLLKVYYETPALLFAGIMMQVGAIGIISRQIKRSIIAEKEPTRLAAG
jgi:hypothetical protein